VKITNKFGLPEPFYKALANDEYVKVGDYSATTLIKSPLQAELARRHEKEIVKDCTDFTFSAFGTAMHHFAEKFAKDGEAFAEERFVHDVQGPFGKVKLSGQVDLLTMDKLYDYKTVGTYSFLLEKKNGYVKPDWEKQLNIYRWLAVKAGGFDPKELYIIAILRDWMRSKTFSDPEYPKCPVFVVKVPMWSMDKAEAYIMGRIRIHEIARNAVNTSDITPCTPEERWARPDSWAVKKPKNKRAFRVFDDEVMAKAAAKDLAMIVEYRPGVNNHCIPAYCDGAAFCDFYQRLNGKNKEATAA